ncbi:MAG: hypothetical protein A2041_04785, partial [Bacteroidetes bacterium GWA2_31_9b]
LWRGNAISDLPSFEPSVEIQFRGLSSGIWAAQSIDGKYSELDIYLKYSIKNISFGIFDYYCPSSFKEIGNYYNLNQRTTKHTLDFHFFYNGSNNFPFKFLIATMVFGDDINPESNKNYYSTYAEIDFTLKIQNLRICYVLGFNPYKSYYGDKSGIINTGIKTSGKLNLSRKSSIPIQTSVLLNPLNDIIHISMGITI